jgi:subtilisin family serine protease
VIADLERSGDVLYAEPDAVRSTFVFPDDSLRGYLWGLLNTGQNIDGVTGTPDADIDASEAWDVTTGAAAITVGILDTGIDLTHPDLVPNLWANPGESGAGRETNGVDDDANGLVDDWRGWDWVADDNAPADENWHGTHVAGTVGARGNDATGIAGVAWHVGLAPLRVLDASGDGQVSDLISAYGYARQKGLKIVNASLGGSTGSQAEYDAIALASNTLFVVAAGNGGPDQIGDNNETTPQYPCNYNLPNIVCVAATDNRDVLAGFSNYGSTAVDLAAPGVDIASSIPEGAWALASGTSMATPHMSGAAALEWTHYPTATVAQIRAALLNSVDAKSSLTGKTVTGGRLNAYRALGGVPALPPATQPAALPSAPATSGNSSSVDKQPPSVKVALRGRLVLKRGVRVRTLCSEACSIRHTLVLSARSARRLGIRGAATLVVGKATGRMSRAGSVTVRLRLTASARRRLRRARHLRLALRTRAVDRAGNVRSVKRSVKLFRR